MKTLLKNRELSAFFAIVALFVVLVALNPAYFSLQTLAMIFSSSQILCLLALGATLVMLTRNIDVSVGSTVGLCAIAVGVALNNGYGLATAIAFALAIGALAGAFNGLLVVGLRIPAIVATLGTLGLYRGVMLLWTGGKWIEGLPDSLKSLSEPAFIGVSPLGWLVLALLLAGGWLLSRTAFGRDFYAAGDNLAAARQLGVAVNRTRMLAFTLNGMLAACAGIVFAAQIGFVPNQTGSGLEMKAIAACVLGGISLLGGTGTLLGAFLGAFFLTQIDTVLVLFRLPAWWNDFIAEQVGDGTVGAEVTPGFGEGVTHFRNGTVTVVGQTFHHHRGAARAVTFINDGFHVRVFIAADAARDGAVQGVASHVVRQRFINGRTQTRVGSRIATAQTRGGDQLANDFRKDFTAFGILCRFAVFGVGPFTMTCHKKLSKKRALSGGVNYKFFNRLPVAPRLGQRSGFRRADPAIGQMFGESNLPLMRQRKTEPEFRIALYTRRIAMTQMRKYLELHRALTVD